MTGTVVKPKEPGTDTYVHECTKHIHACAHTQSHTCTHTCARSHTQTHRGTITTNCSSSNLVCSSPEKSRSQSNRNTTKEYTLVISHCYFNTSQSHEAIQVKHVHIKLGILLYSPACVCVCVFVHECLLQYTQTPACCYRLLPSELVDSQVNKGLPPAPERSAVALQRETQSGHEAQGRQ